jgi:hypothetical protein
MSWIVHRLKNLTAASESRDRESACGPVVVHGLPRRLWVKNYVEM